MKIPFELFGMMKSYSNVVIYMPELLWYWQKGNTRIYTKKFRVAENAMREGFFVMVLRDQSHIFKK